MIFLLYMEIQVMGLDLQMNSVLAIYGVSIYCHCHIWHCQIWAFPDMRLILMTSGTGISIYGHKRDNDGINLQV